MAAPFALLSASGSVPPPAAAVVMLGASIVQRWQEDGAAEWQGQGIASYPIRNAAVSGYTTHDLIRALNDGLLRSCRPKLITLLIGTNNLLGVKADSSLLLEELLKIVTLLRAEVPQAKLALFGLIPIRDQYFNGLVKDLNSRLSRIASEPKAEFEYVDLFSTLTLQQSPQGEADPACYSDGIHLNAEGYRRWAPVLLRLLSQHGIRPADAGA
jgi:lysophospholipase L1-like esterase